MDIDYDKLRYGRDWRCGLPLVLAEDEGSLDDIIWLVFLGADHRLDYMSGVRRLDVEVDILSEWEIGTLLGLDSRESLWEYFGIAGDDPYPLAVLLREGWVGVPGKVNPVQRFHC
jgi:hypothetical protein